MIKGFGEGQQRRIGEGEQDGVQKEENKVKEKLEEEKVTVME